MPDFEVWDRIKVPFPCTDRPVQGRRPALIVAVPAAPGAPVLLWVLMVTSAGHRSRPDVVSVSDLAAAGLKAASVVRPAKIATIEARDAERIGCFASADRLRVAAAVQGSLAPLLTG